MDVLLLQPTFSRCKQPSDAAVLWCIPDMGQDVTLAFSAETHNKLVHLHGIVRGLGPALPLNRQDIFDKCFAWFTRTMSSGISKTDSVS